MNIRDERAGDEAAIAGVIERAFALTEHSNGTEAQIVERLRAAGALAISLVAERDGAVVGHIAFSPVTVGAARGWFGLGPVAVERGHQGEGIGAALIEAGLARLRSSGANGCVVLGDPRYYARFGFRVIAGLTYPTAPASCFQALTLSGEPPRGEVRYHPAFG